MYRKVKIKDLLSADHTFIADIFNLLESDINLTNQIVRRVVGYEYLNRQSVRRKKNSTRQTSGKKMCACVKLLIHICIIISVFIFKMATRIDRHTVYRCNVQSLNRAFRGARCNLSGSNVLQRLIFRSNAWGCTAARL